ncbi:MAG: nucleotidyltransferase family protein [Pyrinomonadaceae bacterium]
MSETPQVTKYAAILLAAGRSSRMGAFKPLLPFGNSTIIEACLDQIEAAGIIDIVVVIGHRWDELRLSLAHRRVSFAVNPDPDSEMSASIAAGVQALDQTVTAVYLALADQPRIPAKIYSVLARRHRNGEKIVVPEFEGHRGHPVLVDLSLRDELAKLDECGGLRGFLDTHTREVYRRTVDCPYVRMDVDTPEDYRNLTEDV